MVHRFVLLVATAGFVASCSASTAASSVADGAGQGDAAKDAAATVDAGSDGAAATATADGVDAAVGDAVATDSTADGQTSDDGATTDISASDSAAADVDSADGQASDAGDLDATSADAGDVAAADTVLADNQTADAVAEDTAQADAGDAETPDADAGIAGTALTDAAAEDSAGSDMVGSDMAATDMAGGATNVDLAGVVWTCADPAWQAKTCAAGVVTAPPVYPGIHVDLPTPITYSDLPPSSGTHRPMWGKWGEYSFLPQQRWLHNLEHGGLALLYHPCAPQATIDALRAFAKAQPDDDGGAFRWVMTPYPNLPTAVALVGWGHLYLAECANPEDMKAFIPVGYRKAPEDEGWDGGYSELWIGK